MRCVHSSFKMSGCDNFRAFMGLSLIYFSGHIDAHRDGLKSMLCPSLIHFVFFKKEKHYGTL